MPLSSSPETTVIIINAEKIKLTGEKLDKKVYRWHPLYPGGLEKLPPEGLRN
jgi:ribosomal protein L13